MKRRYRIFIDVSRAPEWVQLICRLNRNARVIVKWMRPEEALLLKTQVDVQTAFLRALPGVAGIFKNLGIDELRIEKIVEDTAAGTRS